MNQTLKLALAALILSLGMLLSAQMLSKLFVRVRQEQAISVKGYAERDVVSDIGAFACTVSARGASLKEAYEELQRSRQVVTAYLERSGFKPGELELGTIDTTKVMRRNAEGKETNEIEYHDAAQRIEVTSTNVALLRSVATAITELIKDGVDIRASPPSFLISDLKDIKLDLLAAATQDANRRALAIAANSGGRIGALISAQQGVFQITRRNSTDISGYGEYDTSTIEKTAKVVVTLQYAIEPGSPPAERR